MSVPDVLPPSPPTTTHRDRFSQPMHYKPIMSTPDDSPASFPPSSGTGTGSRKRVGFLPLTNVPEILTSTPSHMAILKPLPPSRECQKNGKSILKPYIEPVVSVSTLDGSSDTPIGSAEMLESIAQQLMNNNKGSSLDAYATLSHVIKTFDEIPEDVNTRSCITSILRCIKRDLSPQDQVQSSPIDTNLMTQALKVAVILVWSEHLCPLLTDEFRVFIVDRSINAIVEHTAPKVIIIHYMHLLAMQNFRPGILSTNNRAVRLLEALQEITNHVQGKGAIAERLLIYQRLIEQVKPIMKAKASLWVKEVFLGLSSMVKDIRDKAISVSTRACAAFPSSPTVSVAAREALASTMLDKGGSERTLNTILTLRLEKMVAAKDEATQVPQIWALAILLCNSIDMRLESWTLLRDWLRVLQRCFNCSDVNVRCQAFLAWNRFIHVSRPHEASETIVSMLAKPIITQLDRTSGNTTGKGLRPAAVSSYCMLLYHSFRPAASHKQYTRMWNDYIVKIMGNSFLSKSTANADLCSRIVMALMWRDSSISRVWNENRAHENVQVEPEELPTIDCKWIRSKTEGILQIFQLLFSHSVWGPSIRQSDQAHVAKAWRHFLKAIRDSASKEIKPSTDTRKALSYIIQFIQDTPEGDVLNSEPEALKARAELVCNIAIVELGPMLFLEAMETDVDLRSPFVLGQLLEAVTSDVSVPISDDVQHQTRPSLVNVTQILNRCLRIVNQDLHRAYQRYQQNPPLLRSLIELTANTIRLLPVAIIVSSLTVLEPSLSALMKDELCVAKSEKETISLHQQWIDLSFSVTERLRSLPFSQCKELDKLLTGMATSCNKFTQTMLLESWKNVSQPEIPSPDRSDLADVIERIDRQAEIDCSGAKCSSGDADNGIYPEEVDRRLVDRAGEHDFTDIQVSRTTGIVANDQRGPKQHAHHNDSQIYFVPIESSPRCVDEMESQDMTERQKEVRYRQRTEQVVVFADLRSSPRPVSSRASRAPSVDCEIARKAAALEEMPATPTINRQQDALDEDELPSPTPKARHKTLNLADIEIPSSPPSASANRKTTTVAPDQTSSPPQPQNDAEADMVDLDDADLNGEVSVLEDVYTDQNLASRHSTATVASILDVTILSTHDADTKCTDDVVLGSVVPETGVDTCDGTVDRTGSRYATPPIPEDDQNTATDEIDDLSASQLSQSLDWHIAEEARQSRADAELSPSMPKRKKRTTSGYADHDRKKRRKRTASRTETSMSSFATDESIIGSDVFETGDCAVVSTASLTTPTKRQSSMSTHSNKQDYVTETTATQKLHRSRQQRNDRIPLHLRSPNSQLSEAPASDAKVAAEGLIRSPSRKSTDTGERKSTSHTAVHNPPNNKVLDENTNEIPRNTNIMTALQTALDMLKNIGKHQQANIDLKAIDDLCFNIRYQAQEIVRGTRQS